MTTRSSTQDAEALTEQQSSAPPVQAEALAVMIRPLVAADPERFRDAIRRWADRPVKIETHRRPTAPGKRLAPAREYVIYAEPLIPVPHRLLSDDERRALLAAVHDRYCRGVEPINPWPGPLPEAKPKAKPEEIARAAADRRGAMSWYILVNHHVPRATEADVAAIGHLMELELDQLELEVHQPDDTLHPAKVAAAVRGPVGFTAERTILSAEAYAILEVLAQAPRLLTREELAGHTRGPPLPAQFAGVLAGLGQVVQDPKTIRKAVNELLEARYVEEPAGSHGLRIISAGIAYLGRFRPTESQ
jgi:hypothetical protein